MGWKRVTVEQRRLEIVLAPTVLSISVTDACRRFGVSRQQFYEWHRRWESDGIEGLRDRSRRPKSSPLRISCTLEEEICRLRADHSDWGPRRIRAELMRQGVNPPAKSTVQRTLERNGLISPRPRKRRVSTRFERPSPNDLWQIDAMDMRLKDGTELHVINLLDDHARFLLASRASLVLDGTAAWDCFSIAMNDHGVPKEVLSDNGRYFSGERWQQVSDFERKLWALGVRTIPATPSHPQTLGKLERMHRTQRAWLGRQRPATTLAGMQRRLDGFRWHYNHERPHQGIDDNIPGERYLATPPATPDRTVQFRSVRRTAGHDGVVRYAGWRINLASEWARATVEVVDCGDKVRIVYGDELITSFSTDESKGYIGAGVRRGRHWIPRRIEG